MGNTLDKVAGRVQARLNTHDTAAFTVQPVYVDYPAASTNWLILDAGAQLFVPPYYIRSVTAGVAVLSAVLVHKATYCPSQTVVLTGYSQGAEVVDQVLHSGNNISKVIGVGLVGDAGNYPGKPETLIGNKSNARGVGVYDALEERYTTPASLSSATWSLCSAGDTVCDFKAATRGAALHKIIIGLATHSDYKSDPRMKTYFNGLADRIAATYPYVAPAPASSITDPGLFACVTAELIADFGSATADARNPVMLAKLTKLNCPAYSPFLGGSGYTIANLDGLQAAISLTSITIGAGSAPDLTPISSLPKLSTIDIVGAPASLAPLANAPSLTSLKLQGGTITDPSPLAKMPKLASATLYGQEITDVSSLVPALGRVTFDIEGQTYSLSSCPLGTRCPVAAIVGYGQSALQWSSNGTNENNCGVDTSTNEVLCTDPLGFGHATDLIYWSDTTKASNDTSYFSGRWIIGT